MQRERLQAGERVRVRLRGDEDWTEALVMLASDSDPSSVLLVFEGMVRAPHGAMIGNGLPLTIEYAQQTVTGLLGGDYEIERAAEGGLPQ